MYNDKMLAGFAGTTADALTLFEKFEGKLEKYRGNITRAAVELAKDWRTDRVLRRLEALLAVVDTEHSFYNIRQWRRNRARGRHNSNRLWRTLCPCSSKGASCSYFFKCKGDCTGGNEACCGDLYIYESGNYSGRALTAS